MTPLVVDVETTTHDKGNAFHPLNFVCAWGFSNASHIFCERTPEVLENFIRTRQCLFLAYNAKFDLHWCQRSGIDISRLRLWDLQLAQFIIEQQKRPMPSLDAALEYWGLPLKIDVVKNEYWNKGIDTADIPWEVLEEYTKHDVKSEWDLYQCQLEYLQQKPKMRRLIYLASQDILATQEMEWNGFKYDFKKSEELAIQTRKEISKLDEELRQRFPNPNINFNSDEHLSALLYGGTIKWKEREPYTFTYKDPKKGSVIKERWVEKSEQYRPLFRPIDGTALKKEGVYQTGEDILKQLKGDPGSVSLVAKFLERKTLETKVSRYFEGFPKLYKEKNWEQELLHTHLSHVTAITGRLSSVKPNLQNPDEGVRQCLVSRF